LGGDVALLTLNTMAGRSIEQQVAWANAELARLRPQSRWLVAHYHHPMYPAVKTEERKISPYAKVFPPLFDKHNLDLACECDGHCIKRTIPIRDGKKDLSGVTYVGEGGLCAPQRRPKTDLWYLKGGIAGNGHHVMRLDFADKTLRIRTILLDRTVFDDHSLRVREHVRQN
jgi:hypothetical protein